MVRKIKRLRKPAIILLILVIIAIIGWLVYRAFGPVVQEVWQILQSGNQSDLTEYIQGQGHYGAYIALFMISVLQVVSVILPVSLSSLRVPSYLVGGELSYYAGLVLLLVMSWCLRYCVVWVSLSALQ